MKKENLLSRRGAINLHPLVLSEVSSSLDLNMIDIGSLTQDEKQKISARLLKLDPRDRKEDEISMLKALTEQLEFFNKMNSKQINLDTKLHEKICRRLKYQTFMKGQTAIQFGAKSDRFFIILSGEVSVFLAKSQETIEQEEREFLHRGIGHRQPPGGFSELLEEVETSPTQSQKDELSPINSQNSITHEKRQTLTLPKRQLSQFRRESLQIKNVLSSPQTPNRRASISPILLQAHGNGTNRSRNPFEQMAIPFVSSDSNQSPPKRSNSKPNSPMNFNFENRAAIQLSQQNFNDSPKNLSPLPGGNRYSSFRAQRIPTSNDESFQSSSNEDTSKIDSIKSPTVCVDSNHRSLKNQSKLSDFLIGATPIRSGFAIFKQNLDSVEKQDPINQTKPEANKAEVQTMLTLDIHNQDQQLQQIAFNQIEQEENIDLGLSRSTGASSPRKVRSPLKPTERDQMRGDFTSQNVAVTMKGGWNILRVAETYRQTGAFGDLIPSSIDELEELFSENGVFKFHFRQKLYPGSTFGELGLLEGKPRSALIICSENSEFAIMEKDDYSELLAERDRRRLIDKFEFLKKHIFPDLTNDAIRKIFYAFQKRVVLKNERIFSQGDRADGFYLIKKGEIQLSQSVPKKEFQRSHSEDEGGDSPFLRIKRKIRNPVEKNPSQTFATISRGEYFGEEDVLLKDFQMSRQFTATCTSIKATIYFIDSNFFLGFLKLKPTTESIILRRLAKKQKWRETYKNRLILHELKEKKFSLLDSNSYQTQSPDQSSNLIKEIANKQKAQSLILNNQPNNTLIPSSNESQTPIRSVPHIQSISRASLLIPADTASIISMNLLKRNSLNLPEQNRFDIASHPLTARFSPISFDNPIVPSTSTRRKTPSKPIVPSLKLIQLPKHQQSIQNSIVQSSTSRNFFSNSKITSNDAQLPQNESPDPQTLRNLLSKKDLLDQNPNKTKYTLKFNTSEPKSSILFSKITNQIPTLSVDSTDKCVLEQRSNNSGVASNNQIQLTENQEQSILKPINGVGKVSNSSIMEEPISIVEKYLVNRQFKFNDERISGQQQLTARDSILKSRLDRIHKKKDSIDSILREEVNNNSHHIPSVSFLTPREKQQTQRPMNAPSNILSFSVDKKIQYRKLLDPIFIEQSDQNVSIFKKQLANNQCHSINYSTKLITKSCNSSIIHKIPLSECVLKETIPQTKHTNKKSKSVHQIQPDLLLTNNFSVTSFNLSHSYSLSQR